MAAATGSETKEEDETAPPTIKHVRKQGFFARATGGRALTLERMLKEERYVDLTIRCVDDDGNLLAEFKVNRSFLAAASPVWHASFYGNFKEAEKGATVEYRGVDPSLFQCLIRYSYFLDPKLTMDNALAVRLLSERYQVSGLKMLCDGMLASYALTPTAVCDLLTSAMKYDLYSLAHSCLSNIDKRFKGKHFEQMFESDSFRRLPMTAMRILLKSDGLKVKENNLWWYLRDWADTQAALSAGKPLSEAVSKKWLKNVKKSSDDSKSESASATTESQTTDTTTTTSTEQVSETTPATVTAPATATATATSTVTATESVTAESKSEETQTDTTEPVTQLEFVMSRTTAEALRRGSSDPAKNIGDSTEEEIKCEESDQPKDAMYFLNEVKEHIRFPLFDFEFLFTHICPSGVLSLEEAYTILKARFLPDPSLVPFKFRKRKAVICFDEAKVFTRGRSSGSWGYSGSNDALCITLDKEVALVGIGLWCADGGTESSVNVYRDDNGGGSAPIHTEAMQRFDVGRNREPQPFVFKKPCILEANQRYCVELSQRNVNGNTSYSCDGSSTNITEAGVTLRISSARNSPNGTGTGSGAFPCFYICCDI